MKTRRFHSVIRKKASLNASEVESQEVIIRTWKGKDKCSPNSRSRIDLPSDSHITRQPPTRLLGHTGLGHCPSFGIILIKVASMGQVMARGWYKMQNST